MSKKALLAVLVVAACGGSGAGDPGGSDAGALADAGVPDAGGQPDAGALDAGALDAGAPDGGQADAGQADAGQADAGSDAGTTAACHFTITGEITASGTCNGMHATYETKPDAFFVSNNGGNDTVTYALSANLAHATSPISFGSAESGPWGFSVILADTDKTWEGTAKGGSFQLVFSSSGTATDPDPSGQSFLGTHGSIDGVLPPQAVTTDGGATGSVTIHVEF